MKKVQPIENFMFSASVGSRWRATAAEAAMRVFASGADPRMIPDEQCELLGDGRLRIFVRLPGDLGEAELFVDPCDWGFMQ